MECSQKSVNHVATGPGQLYYSQQTLATVVLTGSLHSTGYIVSCICISLGVKV